MNRKLLITILSATLACHAGAQNSSNPNGFKAFNHLDAGITAGMPGIGFEVATPIGNHLRLRTGMEFMPRFETTMSFNIQSFDNQGNVLQDKFDRLSGMMKDLTGYNVDGTIDMKGKPTMWNFKLMVDVYPFRNKHWHVTAGFYWGPAKIAEAVNITEDSPSLFAVGMYNHIYNVAYRDFVLEIPTPLIEGQFLDPALEERIVNNGRMGVRVGTYSHDIADQYGNIIHRAGEPYRMEPDANSMVKAEARVNNFKPYIGFGYEGRLLKNDDRYKIGFDCGVMFWGGKPDIITHDGTNLTDDVTDYNGSVGRYIDIVKGFGVFPVLSLRITRRIF